MWVIWHRHQGRPDVSATQISSEVDELHGWQSEDTDVFDTYRAHLATQVQRIRTNHAAHFSVLSGHEMSNSQQAQLLEPTLLLLSEAPHDLCIHLIVVIAILRQLC